MTDRGLHIFGRPIGLVLIASYKMLWGFLEVVAGFLIIFSARLLAGELVEDPQDLFINWLLAHIEINQRAATEIGYTILGLGAIKVIIAAGLWYRSWRIRRALIIFLSMVTAFALYQLGARFSILRVLTFLIDVSILFYLWKILPHHLHVNRGEELIS